MEHEFRISAVFDDGGTYTSTHTNQHDAISRYNMFRQNNGRLPAFVGLFYREGTKVVLAKQFTGNNVSEVKIADLPDGEVMIAAIVLAIAPVPAGPITPPVANVPAIIDLEKLCQRLQATPLTAQADRKVLAAQIKNRLVTYQGDRTSLVIQCANEAR